MLLAVSWSQGIEDAWSDIAQFVPKLIGAIAVFLIGWFVARIIRRVAHQLLTRIGFDNWVDRSGLGAPLERAGFADSGLLLARILYYGVLLITLQLTVSVFGDSAVSDALDSMIAFIPRLFIALIIVVITGAVAKTVQSFVGPMVSHLPARSQITTAAGAAIWVVGGLAALNQLGFAETLVDTLIQTVFYSLGLILVIKFGVGGVWAARDRFWPQVYDSLGRRENTAD